MSKVLFEISKEAMKLVRAGKAILSSGGVRALTGEMIEQAKPLLSSTASSFSVNMGSLSLGPAGAAVNLASSLAQNVQSGIIQHSINIANTKLDHVIEQMNNLANALQGLQQVQALSWVTMGFSLANIGISVAGFQMTLKRLDQLQSQLHEFYERYKNDRQNDRIETFRNCLQQLKAHLGFLQERYGASSYNEQHFIQREADIERDINLSENFLRSVANDFIEKNLNRHLASQILFVLLPVYTQAVNEFCCQYFFCHGFQHHLYTDWISVLNEIDSSTFRDSMKYYLSFDKEYATLSIKTKRNAYRIVFESIHQQKRRLALCEETSKMLSLEEYIGIENLLNKYVYEMLPIAVEELNNVNMDALLFQKIESGQYQETEDGSVLLSITE